jgi:spore coat protein U-like protein
LIAALALTPATLFAQNAANIAATTTIAPSLSVTAVRNLDFGTLPQGTGPTIINSADASSGEFSVGGLANASVTLTFGLPTELSDGAGFTIPIDSWTAQTSALGPGIEFFTPSSSGSTVHMGTNGGLAVFVGARISPSPNQAPGNYSAVVQMTVQYF